MKAELKVNGKTIQAEISEEQAKILGLAEEQLTGYERVKKGDVYYLNLINGETVAETECDGRIDEGRYDTGNYYSNETIAENNARADRLLRCLRQWQAQNDEVISKEDWEDNDKDKWCIMYGYGAEELYVNGFYSVRLHNIIYFTTKEKAEEAIEVFKDELKWYYTKYQQRLDEE